MENPTSGAEDVNVFETEEFAEDNSEENNDSDTLGDDADKGDDTQDNDTEDDSEEESEDDTEEGLEDDSEDEGDDNADEEDDADDEETVETIRQHIERDGAKPLPERKSKHQPLVDGDFTENDDGEVIIHAQHLLDEVTSVEGDLRTYLKIHDKGDKAKAQFLAEKVFGFEADGLRPASKVMYDIIDAYVNAPNDAAREKIVDEYFTDALKDEDFESNVFADIVEKADTKVDAKTDNKQPTEDEYKSAIELWNVEAEKKVDAEKLLDDPDFSKALNATPKFDPYTGQELGFNDRVGIALDEIDLSKLSQKHNEDSVSLGGDKKGKKAAKKPAAETRSVFTDTGFVDPSKDW